jgi:antitoxin CptB
MSSPFPPAEMPAMPENLQPERKKLLYRSWYRGNKEMDNLLGHYAQAKLTGMDESELDSYIQLMEENDIDLWNWVSGQFPIPPEYTTLMADIQAFQQSRFK